MAWYAELKRRKWYCINGIDMIQIYSKKLYDDWYNSLTDEQKQRLEEYRKTKAEKRKRDAKMTLVQLGVMYNMMNEFTHERMGDYMECARLVNKDGGIYMQQTAQIENNSGNINDIDRQLCNYQGGVHILLPQNLTPEKILLRSMERKDILIKTEK